MSRSKLIKQRDMSDTAAVLVMVATVMFVCMLYLILVKLTDQPEPDLSLCPFCDQPVQH